MYTYFFLEIFLFCFFLLSESLKKQRFFFYISFLFVIIVFGLKGRTVGNDTLDYSGFFNQQGGIYGTSLYPTEEIEIGFGYYGRLLRILFSETSEIWPYFLTTSLIAFAPIFYLIRRYSVSKTLSILWFLLWNINIYMTNMRQILAMSFILWGCVLFLEKKKYWRILIVIFWTLGYFIHHTTLLMSLILIVLFVCSFTKNQYYGALFFSFLLGFVLDLFGAELMSTFMNFVLKYDPENEQLLRYSGTFGEATKSLTNVFAKIIPAVFIVHFSNKTEINSIFMKSFIFATIFYCVFGSLNIVFRISALFWVLGFCGIFPGEMKKNNGVYSIFIVITILYIIQSFNVYVNWPLNQSTLLPYYFFWE